MTNKYKSLPKKLTDRLSALTPAKICDLTANVHILKHQKDHVEEYNKSNNYFTYVNVACKVTGSHKCYPINMISSKYLVETCMAKSEKNKQVSYVFDSATSNGWTMADIYYDAIVHGLIYKSIDDCIYDGKIYTDMHYLNTNVNIAVDDYYNNQFIGWYIYHEKLDSIVNYSEKCL